MTTMEWRLGYCQEGQSWCFGIGSGFRLGCPLSPTLLNLYVSGMVEELKGAWMRVKVDDKWCGALLFADDIVLLADTGVKLQDIGRGAGLCGKVEDEV